MAEIKYTPAQTSAIETRGGAALVSAAAGSGKTRVLVERLLRRVCDGKSPASVDRFLVITYTRAAAAELRSRILDELLERLALEPGNTALRRQTALLGKAEISTIHSFCGHILRENAHLLDIAPDFRTLDNNEADIIRRRVMEDEVERAYELGGEDFPSLVDSLAAARDDKRILDTALELRDKMHSHPDAASWAADTLARLESCGSLSDAGDTPWGRPLLLSAKRTAGYWADKLTEVTDALDERASAAYSPALLSDIAQLRALRDACGSWDEARKKADIEFVRLGTLRKYDGASGALAKKLREGCKSAVKKLREVFDCSSAELFEDVEATLPPARALFALVLRFDESYAKEKKRLRALDFTDLEDLAVKLLVAPGGAPTETAREISERFDEIMADEYQDVNPKQELILRAVSKNGANLFMVGDVKQSIYRFRLADPTIFIGKYDSFPPLADAADGGPRKILLQENFRSREGVLAGANFVFSHSMSRELGEIDYGKDEALRCGRTDYLENGEKCLELSLIECPRGDEDSDKTEADAEFAAKRISELVGTMLVQDGSALRPLEYGDVAVLLRSAKGRSGAYLSALRARGIPCVSEGGGDFWGSAEITVAVSLLAVADNPTRDVALISVLRSPLFGFSADELAEIRAAGKELSFFEALKIRAAEDEKCAAFLSLLAELRLVAPDMSGGDFLWLLYCKTDALSIFGAMRRGSARRANLMLLLDLAREADRGGQKGLFGLVKRLRESAERNADMPPAETPEAKNAVLVTTIHKSKGLEYPVVFLAGTDKLFNFDDLKRPLLIHPELGIGLKRRDLKRGIEYSTLPRDAIAARLRSELLSEEMRVLYVGMTRAKEKLIISAVVRDTDALFEKLLPFSPTPEVLSGCSSVSEWLLLSALRRPEASPFPAPPVPPEESDGFEWDMRLIKANPEKRQASDEDAPAAEKPPVDCSETLRRLDFRYPHPLSPSIPSKLTATGLKGRFLDLESAEEAGESGSPRFSPRFDRPRFVSEASPLTGAEKGTALHLAMQYIDYPKCTTPEGVRGELRRLAVSRTLTEKQAASIEPERICTFFRSETGRRVLAVSSLLREFKFSLLVPAETYFPGAEGESILLQGVVDCCFEEKGELYIIDYKTDYVNPGEEKQKLADYSRQLGAYAMAMNRITGKPVRDAILYFFRTGVAVSCGGFEEKADEKSEKN